MLSIVSALALATGVAFAGGASMSHQQSYESSSPELLSDAEMWSRWSSRESSMSDRELLAESDVMYIYPMQVTEYYLLVPSVDSETPMGG